MSEMWSLFLIQFPLSRPRFQIKQSFNTNLGSASRGASYLLAAPLEMCAQCGTTISAYPNCICIVDDAYPYPTRAEDFYLITLGQVTPTIPHLAKTMAYYTFT